MSDTLKKIHAFFYRSFDQREPVRAWLKDLPPGDRQVIGEDIATVEYGWPIGMPVCRPLGRGLWEVRSSLPSQRIARVYFMAYEGQMVLLHGVIKKTQKARDKDLELARKRMKEVLS